MTVSVSEHKSFYKLIQGDCLKILPTFESQSVDMVVTDPPYGINKDGIINDDLPLKKYRLWMKQIIAEIERITKNAYFIFHSETMLFNLVDLYEDCRLFASCNNFAIMGRGIPYAWSPVVFKIKNNESWLGKGRNWFICNTANLKTTPKKIGHPTPKPLDVIKYIISLFDSETVLDPFVGSGTTMKACQDLQRNCIGIEINPDYCEIVKRRCFGRQFLDREVEYKFEVFL